MPPSLFINTHIQIPHSELDFTTSRSGGPGGQHVNKTSTRVSVRWNVVQSAALNDEQRERIIKRLSSRLTNMGDLIIHVDTTRSQIQNRELALERLATIVEKALIKPKKRLATKPTKRAQRKRLDEKTRSGHTKRQRQQSRNLSGDDL